MRIATLAIAGLTLAMAAGAATGALADTRWDHQHPRRDQVNDRLENQNRRIRIERREGEISPWQARRLHGEDYRIRLQEQRFARHDHGHITAREQRRLNREENHVSRQIGR
jgi:hypothetical protein